MASFTESTPITIQTLARNAVARATLDLRSKVGAYILVRLGRGGTTALTNGVDVRVRRTVGNNATLNPDTAIALRSDTVAAASTTCAGSGNAAGSSTLDVASTTGMAADDIICIQDATTPTSATEWSRIARVTTSTQLLLDSPLKSSHANTAHTVRNKANVWQTWADGGSTVEIVVDYGDDSTGESVTVQVDAQVQDSY